MVSDRTLGAAVLMVFASTATACGSDAAPPPSSSTSLAQVASELNGVYEVTGERTGTSNISTAAGQELCRIDCNQVG